jgi:DNA-directed RNA polymerase specialized sigma24 family protein
MGGIPIEERKNTVLNRMLRVAVVKADLSPVEAWAFVLHSFGMSQAEIGEKLGVGQRNAARAIERARHKIHQEVA